MTNFDLDGVEEFTLNSDIADTAAGSMSGDLAQLQTAVYGRDVRASFAEGLYILWNNQYLLNDTSSEVTATLETLTETVATQAETIAALEETIETLETRTANLDYLNIVEGAKVYTSDYNTYTLTATGTLSLTLTSPQNDEEGEQLPRTYSASFYSYKDCITRAVVSGLSLYIPNYLFSGLTNLTYVSISSNVSYIGNYIFYGCDGLRTIYYGGTAEQWDALSKDDDWYSGWITHDDTITIICSDGTVQFTPGIEQDEEA